VLAGRVTVGPRARILPGAVLTAEGSRVDIGESSIVSEHAVLRATAATDTERPVVVGDRVLIGPHATLLGCTIESAAFIATGATVVQGAHIGAEAIVAVGAFVHAGTVLPDGFLLAPNMIAIGDPVTVYAPDDPTLPEAIRKIGFARYAFGLDSPQRREIAEVRSQEYSAHLEDEIIEP
jgi:carbonic anhydrase/acetyltransferase-like protein (isoleucine patch superfamily)